MSWNWERVLQEWRAGDLITIADFYRLDNTLPKSVARRAFDKGTSVLTADEKLALLDDLDELGVFVMSKPPLEGKAVVFTGQLADMTRETAQELVVQMGGTTPKGINKQTSILVVANAAEQTVKIKKAKSYGIEIWTEDQWLEKALAWST